MHAFLLILLIGSPLWLVLINAYLTYYQKYHHNKYVEKIQMVLWWPIFGLTCMLYWVVYLVAKLVRRI